MNSTRKATSFVANQALYKTGVDFLYRLENTQAELAGIIGSDFTDTATRATIFNGIEVTYSTSSEPYSFDWKGLRIDSSAKVRYFNRFNSDTSTHKKEFIALFGLQASQDESDIFEDNFGVESVATVKGLKLVADGQFAGITLQKITSANESAIDSLTSISTSTRAIFHSTVQSGKTLYTPSAPVTYGEWQGLFYITINFDTGEAGYIIGEGLNGGFTISQFDSPQEALLRSVEITNLSATILAPSNNQTFDYGDFITWTARYTATMGTSTETWDETGDIPASYFRLSGTTTLWTGYGTTSSVSIHIGRTTLGEVGKNTTFDKEIINAVSANNLPSDFASVLKLMIKKESGFETLSTRYEPCVDKTYVFGQIEIAPEIYEYRVNLFPFSDWRLPGSMPSGTALTKGTSVDGLKAQHSYTPYEMIKKFSRRAGTSHAMKVAENDSIYKVWSENDSAHNYTDSGCNSADITSSNANYPAQLLDSTSYGLGQIVYAYHWSKFETNGASPARDIWEMFWRKTNIDISTVIFKEYYDSSSGTQGTSCVSGDRLWKTIAKYNGGPNGPDIPASQAYANDICTKYGAGNYQVST